MSTKIIAVVVGVVGAAGVAYYLLTRPAVAKVETIITVTEAPPPTAGASVPFEFGGHLEDIAGNRLVGKNVILYFDGVELSTCPTFADGRWNFHVGLPVGTHELYVEFPGDEQYEGC